MLKFQEEYTHQSFEDFILVIGKALLNDTEIIKIALCGEIIGVDSENAWYSFVKKNFQHLFARMCSQFNCTRRNLSAVIDQILSAVIDQIFIEVAKQFEDAVFIADSFPLAVCKFGRAHSPLVKSGSVILGDKGYISEPLENALKRSNAREPHPKDLQRLIFKTRQRIETTFSQLTEQFNAERVLAKSFAGLCFCLLIKFLAFNLCILLSQSSHIKSLIFTLTTS